MGMLTDFFVASQNEGPTYADRLLEEDDEALADFTVASHKGLTGLEVSRLHALLEGQDFSVERHMFEVVSGEEQEGLTEQLPDAFVANLASITDESLQSVSEQWAVAIQEEVSRQPSELLPIVSDLRALAKLALKSSNHLFLWYSI